MVASPAPVPVADMGKGMFHPDSLAQLGPPCYRLLALPQLLQQPLIRVDMRTATVETGRTPPP